MNAFTVVLGKDCPNLSALLTQPVKEADPMEKGRGRSSLVITNSTRVPEQLESSTNSLPSTAGTHSSPEGNGPLHAAACSHVQTKAHKQHSSRITGIAIWQKEGPREV